MSRYNCNLSGACVPSLESWSGQYASLEECQLACQPLEDREALDLAYIVLGYDWDLALQLSPQDQMELVFRTFGDRVSGEVAGSILYLLNHERVDELLALGRRIDLPGLTSYVESQLDDLDWFILELNKLARPTLYHSGRREQILRIISRILPLQIVSDADAIYYITDNLSWHVEIDLVSHRGERLTALVTEWLPRLKLMIQEE